MAGTFNGLILEARCKPIISILEDIRFYVMKRLAVKKQSIHAWINDVSPRAIDKLMKNQERSFDWVIDTNGNMGYEVMHTKNSTNRHVVEIQKLICTYREWQLTGIPCLHAVCAMHREGLDPVNYVAYWYTKNTYVKAYSHPMKCVLRLMLWERVECDQLIHQQLGQCRADPKRLEEKTKMSLRRLANCLDREERCTARFAKEKDIMLKDVLRNPKIILLEVVRRKCINKINILINPARFHQ